MRKFGNFKRKSKKRFKPYLEQMARALMLPIAVLPIAGLLLGIGGAIGANLNSASGLVAANIFKGISEVVFANLAILFSVGIAITFTNNKGAAAFAAVLAYLVFTSSQFAFLQFQSDGTLRSVLWFHRAFPGLVGTNLGIKSLNTSIFGGIVIGILSAFIFNRVIKIKVPEVLAFFSGIRLVPIVLIPATFLVALVFLLFWPWIGLLILRAGQGIQAAPSGSDGLLYGILGRLLQPFGLHHIPIALAFQSEFGGILDFNTIDNALAQNKISLEQATLLKTAIQQFSNNSNRIVGDQNIWNFINSLPFNRLQNVQTNVQEALFPFFKSQLGVNAGRFTQDYPTYLGTSVGIGAAIIYCAEKEQRKLVATTVGSSMLVAFFTGITEPLEFTFLFVAPLLYYLIYVPLSGLAYMLMTLSNAHIGVGFARGFIDLVIYGIVPVAKGTNFWFAFIYALLLGGFAFLSFSFFIKKMKIATPGRLGNNLGLLNKAAYQKQKALAKEKVPKIILKSPLQGTILKKENLKVPEHLNLETKNALLIKLANGQLKFPKNSKISFEKEDKTKLLLFYKKQKFIFAFHFWKTNQEVLNSQEINQIITKQSKFSQLDNKNIILSINLDYCRAHQVEHLLHFSWLQDKTSQNMNFSTLTNLDYDQELVSFEINSETLSDSSKPKEDSEKVLIKNLLEALGGKKNLITISACATRLRLSLHDSSFLEFENFKKFGAYGLVKDQNSVQIIFGGKAERYANLLNELVN